MMYRKVSKKTVLVFALFCLLSLGIGVGLGYGIQTQGLLGTAVKDNAGHGNNDVLSDVPSSSGMVGASRPNYGVDIRLMCQNCREISLFGNPLPAGGPVCPICGEVIPT